VVTVAGEPVGLDPRAVISLLQHGTIEITGRLVDASNATLYGTVTADGLSVPCVYKPVAGERPLWDFPRGTLAHREVASYLVSVGTGWDIVPPTVLRDGPFGLGMVQRWIEVDEDTDLLALARSRHPQLRRMAIFDAVVNNADRKGGHLLPTADGHIHGCDHGVCFAVQDKLRTLLWQWRGQRLPAEATVVLSDLRSQLAPAPGGPPGALAGALRQLLSAEEIRATLGRIDRLLDSGRHPMPSADWPAIPWPPF